MNNTDKYKKTREKYFASQKIGFRAMHGIVGEIVALAEKEKLPLDEFVRKYISKEVADEVFDLGKYAKRRKHVFDVPKDRTVYVRPPRPTFKKK